MKKKLMMKLASANEATVEEDNINEDELFYHVDIDEKESEHLAAEPYSYWKSVLRVFLKKPAARVGLVSLVLFLLAIFIIPLFTPEGYLNPHVTEEQIMNAGYGSHTAPSWSHLFGCDSIGRDLFFLCFASAKKSLGLGILESVIVTVVGTLVGLAWGYFKKLDAIFIEIYNLISNVPSLLLYLILATIIRDSFSWISIEGRLVLSLTIFGWLGVALSIRNLVIIITDREYNVASKTLGTPPFRIMIKNLLPYIMSVIIINISLTIPGMISSEVSMSYFGFGLNGMDHSIGAILNLGIKFFSTYPWELLAPAFVLFWIILTFFLIGNALSDALDPKTHR